MVCLLPQNALVTSFYELKAKLPTLESSTAILNYNLDAQAGLYTEHVGKPPRVRDGDNQSSLYASKS